MKRTIKTILLLTIICVSGSMKAQSNFDIAFQDTSLSYVYAQPFATQLTNEGGVIAVVFPSGNNGLLEITKLDASGNTMWKKNIVDTSYQGNTYINVTYVVKKIIELANGDFLIEGESGTNSYALYVKLFIKISSNGNLLWTKRFNASVYTINELKQTSDHGFIVCGTQSVPNGSNTAALILKLDSLGNRQWEKQVDFTGENDFFFSATELSSGGFMACGLAIVNPIAENGILVKFDANGNMIWSKTVPGYSFHSIDELPGGNMMLSSDNPNMISKIDSSGNFLWSEKFDRTNNAGGSSNLNYYSFTKNKQVILSGAFLDQATIRTNAALKIDTTGNLLWARKYLTDTLFPFPIYTFNAQGIDTACLFFTTQNIVKTDSSGFVNASTCFFSDTVHVVATSFSPVAQTANPTVMDTVSLLTNVYLLVDNNTRFVPYDPCSSSPASVAEMSTQNSHLTIYPNPATDEANILLGEKIDRIEIYNLTGELVKKSTQTKINISDFPSGIYFVEVYSEAGVQVQKLIKQ